MLRKIKLTTILIATLVLLLVFYVSTSLLPSQPSVISVRLNFLNHPTGSPIKGLAVNFSLTTRTQHLLTISGVTDDRGTLVQTVAAGNVAFPVSARENSISGLWVLAYVTGEKTWSIADQKWFATNPSAFASNYSEYMFDGEIRPAQERSGSTLNLTLSFHLTQGKLIAIYDPIPEARSLDYHLEVNFLNCNFVEFKERTHAVCPVGKPLRVDLEVNYHRLQWISQISVDVGNRAFIDLRPSLIRAISSAQIEELTKILDNLKPYGFELTDQYTRIAEVSELYYRAIEAIGIDHEAFRINVQSAMNIYRDLYEEITSIYANALWWIPSLMIIFLFFSLSISTLITNRRDHRVVVFAALLSAVFCLFFFTQPYLKLFISNPLILLQSFTWPISYTRWAAKYW